MTPDSHIKQHVKMFRAAEGGLEDFRSVMNYYNRKTSLSTIENCHLYILCILCNACSLIKNYCLCDQRWEEVYITGNIYTLINESIKKIIGFKRKNGTRPLSLCDKLSLVILASSKEEFNSLRDELINYADNEVIQKIIQNERTMSVHFDENLDAINLFRFQSGRNAQQAFNHFILWFSLLHKFHAFISKNLDNGTK